MFCYCQFRTEDAGEHGSAEENRRNFYFEETNGEAATEVYGTTI